MYVTSLVALIGTYIYVSIASAMCPSEQDPYHLSRWGLNLLTEYFEFSPCSEISDSIQLKVLVYIIVLSSLILLWRKAKIKAWCDSFKKFVSGLRSASCLSEVTATMLCKICMLIHSHQKKEVFDQKVAELTWVLEKMCTKQSLIHQGQILLHTNNALFS